jgi:hypothetical protein
LPIDERLVERLLTTYGVQSLLSARHRRWRLVGVCLLLAIPLQFSHFYRS